MNNEEIYKNIYEKVYGLRKIYNNNTCDKCGVHNVACYGLGGPSYEPYNGQDVMVACDKCSSLYNPKKLRTIKKIIDASSELGFIINPHQICE